MMLKDLKASSSLINFIKLKPLHGEFNLSLHQSYVFLRIYNKFVY